MSEQFFAEATVRLRPDLTGFITELRTEVKAAVEAVESGANPPSIRIRPALTRDFVGELRRQADAAIKQAGARAAPILARPGLITGFVGEMRRQVTDAVATVNTQQQPVRVRPGLTAGFQGELLAQTNEVIDKVTAQTRAIRARPGLITGFIGDLRREANDAIDRASNNLRPLRVRANIEALSRRQLAQFEGALAGAPGIGAGAAGIASAVQANQALAQTQERVNSLLAQGAVLLDEQGQSAERAADASAASGQEQQQTVQQQLASEAGTSAAIEKIRDSIRQQAAARTKGAKDAAAANKGFEASEQRLAALRAQGGVDLSQLAQAQAQVTSSVEESKRQTQQAGQASKGRTSDIQKETAAMKQLVIAEERLQTARLLEPGTEERRLALLAAEEARVRALARAQPSEVPGARAISDELKRDLDALQQEQRQALQGSAKVTEQTGRQTEADRALGRVRSNLQRATEAVAGSKDELDARRAVERLSIRALVAAREEENLETEKTVTAIREENSERLKEIETDKKRQQSLRRTTSETKKLSLAERELNATRQALAASLVPGLSRRDRIQELQTARRAAARGVAGAEGRIASATFPAAAGIAGIERARQAKLLDEILTKLRLEEDALQRERKSVSDSARAQREYQREQSKSARSQEQLRRGAQATGLSFLGIRGATLAASSSFLVGAAALTVFAKALQSASEFTDQLNVFRATASATAQEMERVRDAARQLGADITLPGVSAADAAGAMVELAKAGLGVEDSIDGARGVLQLATAAAIENAQAVELAANALNAFELEGRDAVRVADVFANAANAAQGSIVDIGIAFQQASAAGRQVGLSFEDTSTFLTILARNGLRGSDAGTSLRTALIRLIRPTKDARDRLRDLGVQVRDAQGNLRPDIFLQLAAATRDLSPAARDATIALIGGQDAFRAISILGRQSVDDFFALRRELREQGTAAELAAARTQGLRGSLEALSNTLSTIGVRAGQSITPAIQSIVAGITTFAAAMAASEQSAQLFGGAVEFVETAIFALGQTIQTLATVAAPVAGILAGTANAIGVPTILAAVAAYKLLPAIFLRIQGAAQIMTTAIALSALQGINPLRAGVVALARSFNPVLLGATALSAGLFFLVTRETQAERATRRLEEATNDLAGSLARARDASRQAQGLELSVSGAELGVLEARQAADRAREALAGSRAARGSFERRKLELQLRVALDDVTSAQQRYRQAQEDSFRAQLESTEASRTARKAREEEIDALVDLVEAADRAARRRDSPHVRGADLEARAQKDLIEQIRERARAARETEDADQILLARRLDLLARVAEATGNLPTPKAIRIAINADSAQQALRDLATEFNLTRAQLSGAEIRLKFKDIRQEFRALFAPFLAISQDEGDKAGDAFSRAVANAIASDKAKDRVRQAAEDLLRGALGRAQARGAGLRREELDITIAGGSEQERLANLQAQAQAAREELAIREQQQREGRIGFEQVTAAKERLAGLLEEIRSIQEEMTNDAKEAAQEAKDRKEERDQALLQALGFAREDAQERILDAQAKDGLRDDIKRTRELRQLVLRQIETVGERIKSAELRIQALRELRRISRDLKREIDALQQQQRQELRDRAAERNQLDIEFAQTTENRNAEIRARQREIRRLKRLQALTKAGTLEYKRLRNQIAEQQQAIKDLKEQQNEKNNEFKQLAFAFLQAQQGFAANLIGNLIPGEALGGLVGNREQGGPRLGGRQQLAGGRDLSDLQRQGTPPGLKEFGGGLAEALVGAQRTASQAGRLQGVTTGQGNTQIDLLRKILVEVRRANRTSDHPEAKQQRKAGSAALDYGGGTSMGM